MNKTILTIGGLDTWGGGGIGTDLKTIEKMNMFGLSVITCCATIGKDEPFIIQAIDTSIVADQLATIEKTFKLDAIKIGLLYTPEIIEVVKKFLESQNCPVIIDPVLVFKEANEEALTYQESLMPLFKYADILTPNLAEGLLLLMRRDVDFKPAKRMAKELNQLYNVPVILKGGNRMEGNVAVDFFNDGYLAVELSKPKVDNLTIHGAGCGFATMIACQLANGKTLLSACENAKAFVHEGIVNHYPLSESTGNLWNRKGLDE